MSQGFITSGSCAKTVEIKLGFSTPGSDIIYSKLVQFIQFTKPAVILPSAPPPLHLSAPMA